MANKLPEFALMPVNGYLINANMIKNVDLCYAIHLDHWQIISVSDLMILWKFKSLFGDKCGGIQSSKDVNKF